MPKYPKQAQAESARAKPQPPRTLEELTKAYSDLAAQHGNLDYQRRCLEMETQRTWQQMLNINQEAAERQKLDADKKAAATKEV